MKSDQAPSYEEFNPGSASSSEPSQEVSEKMAGGRIPVDSQPLFLADDEVLRERVRRLMPGKPPSSTLQRASTNPIVAIVVGFILTGVLGGLLTNHYNSKQKELELLRTVEQRELDRRREDDKRESDRLREDEQRKSDQIYQKGQKDLEYQRALNQMKLERQGTLNQRELEREHSFYDELNKTRAQKIAEVWESIYKFEADASRLAVELEAIISELETAESQGSVQAIDIASKRLDAFEEKLNDPNLSLGGPGSKLDEITKKNRFWLGEHIYHQIESYIDVSSDCMLAKAERKSKEQQKELFARRDKLRQSILAIRNTLLKREGTSND